MKIYSEMTDFEINEAVSMVLLPQAEKPEARYVAIGNYCNSWADAGPIIESNLIAIKPVELFVGGHRWFAKKGDGDLGVKAADNNPRRAAMIVFLMMNEAHHE